VVEACRKESAAKPGLIEGRIKAEYVMPPGIVAPVFKTCFLKI